MGTILDMELFTEQRNENKVSVGSCLKTLIPGQLSNLLLNTLKALLLFNKSNRHYIHFPFRVTQVRCPSLQIVPGPTLHVFSDGKLLATCGGFDWNLKHYDIPRVLSELYIL